MKTIATLVLLTATTVAVNASPVIKDYYTVVMDENGHGFITHSAGYQIVSIQSLAASTNVADPFATAHPDNPPNPNPLTLNYKLPDNLQAYWSRLTYGDVVVNEGGGTSGNSDLIRISSDGRIYTYSDLDDSGYGTAPSLADVGVPLNFQPISSVLPERYLSSLATLGIDIPGGAYGCYYQPSRGQAGSVTNGIFGYCFLSEGATPPTPAIPEPATVVAGALMLVPLGAGILRKFRKAQLSNSKS